VSGVFLNVGLLAALLARAKLIDDGGDEGIEGDVAAPGLIGAVGHGNPAGGA